jgi:serine/threonine protein phosphatase PrpC
VTSTNTAVTTTSTWDLTAPGIEEDLVVTVATATHPGDKARNADAVAVEHYATAGTVAAAVLDGKGTSAETARAMRVCAPAAVMLAARYGALNGLSSAGSMLADPGREFVPVDGVGALAVVRPGSPVAVVHVGRARAHTWSGHELAELTEDHTHGQQLRNVGRTEQEAAAYDRLQRVTLARSTVGTIPSALTDDELVLLTTHGVHSVLGLARMTEIVRVHQHTGAAAVADELLHGALEHGRPGDRDNASVIAIALIRTPRTSAGKAQQS